MSQDIELASQEPRAAAAPEEAAAAVPAAAKHRRADSHASSSSSSDESSPASDGSSSSSDDDQDEDEVEEVPPPSAAVAAAAAASRAASRDNTQGGGRSGRTSGGPAAKKPKTLGSLVWDHFAKDPADPEYALCTHCPAGSNTGRVKRAGGSTSSMAKHVTRVHHVLLVAQGVAKDDTQTIMDGKLVFVPNFKHDAIFWMLMTYQVRQPPSLGFCCCRLPDLARIFFSIFVCMYNMYSSISEYHSSPEYKNLFYTIFQ